MLKRRLALGLAALVVVAASVTVFAQTRVDGDRTTYGAGTNSCGQWSEAREHDATKDLVSGQDGDAFGCGATGEIAHSLVSLGQPG